MKQLSIGSQFAETIRIVYGAVILALVLTLINSTGRANTAYAAVSFDAYHVNFVPSADETVQYPAYLADAPAGTITDHAGMPNRGCASYVAWQVIRNYHYLPGTSDFVAADFAGLPIMGIPTGDIPKPGSALVEFSGSTWVDASEGIVYRAGTTGHIAWVEQVLANGDLIVSQYNESGDGQFNRVEINPNDSTLGYHYGYIYFGEAAYAK